MNLHTQREEARRRRLINRSVAQNRELFFETVRGNTVNYAVAPMRRNIRMPQGIQDIDDPLMTRTLQIGIVLAMLAITYLFRAPLAAAFQSLFF